MKLTKLSLIAILAVSAAVAGGDIAPTAEPVPAAATFPQWDFSGQAKLYYQTSDAFGVGSLFEQESSLANAGLQLNAVGKFDYGLSAGAQLTGLGTLGLQNSIVSNIMQSADGNLNGGAVTKLYGAWANDTTTVKLGRQELPKSLSPFAYSADWNVFENTYDAGLIVNTSIPNTTLVGALVYAANQNGVGAWDGEGNWFAHPIVGDPNLGGSNLNDFNQVNGDDGIWMLTAQNKSIAGLTATGSFYYAANLVDNLTADITGDENLPKTGNSASILWGDLDYANADLPVTFGLQGGTVNSDDFINDTTAWGAKIGGNLNMFSIGAAYSSVDDGDTGVFNVGDVKTPLYTQMILNQSFISNNADTLLVEAGVKALGGSFSARYGMTTMNDRPVLGDVDYNEFDFIYKTKVWNESTTLFAGYFNQDLDKKLVDDREVSPDSNNVIRLWARYDF